MRKPELYASLWSDDDYWKLYHRWGGEYASVPGGYLHPLLGWSQSPVTASSPLGLDKQSLTLLAAQDKRAILFYGDSFVDGVAEEPYFIPNYLTTQLENAVVVDLSVGGYGLDQMYLLFQQTYQMVEHPHVIVGVLTKDVDRAILSVRTAQKPYFVIDGDKLVLQGTPVTLDQNAFFESNPPGIVSYLFSLLRQRIEQHGGWDYRHGRKTEAKKRVNARIIREIQFACEERSIPLTFVIFYAIEAVESHSMNWREEFLQGTLTELGISFIDTKVLLNEYAITHGIPVARFYDAVSGHHNNFGNTVIATGILESLKNAGYD